MKFSRVLHAHANQTDFETEEPAHGAFSSLCNFLEGLVNVYLLIAVCDIPLVST